MSTGPEALAADEQKISEAVRRLLQNGAEIQNIYTMIISSAIQECCECSHVALSPRRLALALAKCRIDTETVSGIAARFATCSGMATGECYYPPSPESI